MRKMAIAAAKGRFDWKMAWSVISTDSVQCCGRPSTWGSRYAPSVNTNTMMSAPRMVERMAGTTTVKKVRKGDAPSMRAASGSCGSRRDSGG